MGCNFSKAPAAYKPITEREIKFVAMIDEDETYDVSEDQRKQKDSQINEFLESRFPKQITNDNHPQLTQQFQNIVYSIKDDIQELMNKYRYMFQWSARKFREHLCEIIVQVEKRVLRKFFLKLKDLVILIKHIQASSAELTLIQRQILRQVIKGSIIQRYFGNTNVQVDDYFSELARFFLKELRNQIENDSQFQSLSDEEMDGMIPEIMNNAQKNLLRNINLSNYTIAQVVRHHNLVLDHPNIVTPNEFTEENDIIDEAVSKDIMTFLEHIDVINENGVIKESFNFYNPNLFENSGGKHELEKYKSTIITVLRSVGLKDRLDKEIGNQICQEILDLYREYEDSSKIGNAELKEIAELSGIKNPDIYKRLLSQWISDIDNDPLLDPQKLRMLAGILLQVAGQPRNETGLYCNGDDLNACLRMVVQKFSSILISADNVQGNIFDMYDILNVILKLMALMNLSGMKEEDKEHIKSKINNFTESTLHKIRKGVGMTKEYGNNLGLKVRQAFANEALNRIEGTYAEEMGEADEQNMAAIMGCASIIKGCIAMDLDQIQEGLSGIADVVKESMEPDPKDAKNWYTMLPYIQILASDNFEKFAHEFLSEEPTEVTNKLKKMKGKAHLEYYLVEELSKVARDRTQPNEARYYAVNTLFKINQQRGMPLYGWIKPSAELRYYIINKIVQISLLTEKNAEKQRIIERAKVILSQINETLCEEDQEWIEDVKGEYGNMEDEFSDTPPTLTNKVLTMALQQRMMMNYFLSSLNRKGENEYQKYVKPLTMIRIQGELWIDGKIQNDMMKQEAQDRLGVSFDKIKKDISQLESKVTSSLKKMDTMKPKQFKKQKSVMSINEDDDEDGLEDSGEPINHILITVGITSFLESKSKVLLIQGDAGTGKSIFLKMVEHTLQKQFSRGETQFIPVFVRLSEIKNASSFMLELLQQYQMSRQVFNQIKDSNRKFLLLLDGYDELKSPKNMFTLNKLIEWKGEVKILVSSRQQYLVAFGNYTRFFKPNFRDKDQNVLMEYRISDVSSDQRKVYIDKTVLATNNKINQLNPQVDFEEIEYLKEWSTFEKYRDSIEEIPGLVDLIKTPYMLTIIMNILPQLYRQRTNKDEQIGKSAIYKTFTKQFFDTAQAKLLDNEGLELPKGFDLEQSFYNFSTSLAIKMFLNDKTSVTAIESKFKYPSKANESNPFEEYFHDDPITKYSRSGAPILISDGQCRFTHKSIMEYFSARVFYEEFKTFDKIEDKLPDFSKCWSNDKLFQGQGVTDQESDVINFIIDMIIYNDNKYQYAILQGEEPSKMHALARVIELSEKLNSMAINKKGEVQIDKLKDIWKQNILAVSSRFPDAYVKFDGRIIDEMIQSPDTGMNLKESLIIGRAKMLFKDGMKTESQVYFNKALGYRLGGVNYDGDVIGKTMDNQTAHGQGRLTIEDGTTYIGQFVQGKLKKSGKIEIEYPDGIIYKGQWNEGKRHGNGILKDLSTGMEIHSTYKEDKIVNDQNVKGVVGNPVLNTDIIYFDTNDLKRWKTSGSLTTSWSGTVDISTQKDYEGVGTDVSPKDVTYYKIESGSVIFKSPKMSYKKYQTTGLPNQNFIISFDFQTSEQSSPLFSLNDKISGGHDRHIYLVGGKAKCRIWPAAAVDAHSERNYADGNWHKVKLVCLKNAPKAILYIDNENTLEIPSCSQSNFDWVTQICLGYSDDIPNKKFTGTIKNVKYIVKNLWKEAAPQICFEKFTQDKSSYKTLCYDSNNLDFSQSIVSKSNTTIATVEQYVGTEVKQVKEITLNNGWLSLTSTDFRADQMGGLPNSNFEMELEFSTQNQDWNLFCLDSQAGNTAGSCRELFLISGQLFLKFHNYPQVQITFDEQQLLNDSEWHSVKICSKDEESVKVYVDNKLVKELDDYRTDFNYQNRINFGWAKCHKEGGYKGGSFRNFSYYSFKRPINQIACDRSLIDFEKVDGMVQLGAKGQVDLTVKIEKDEEESNEKFQFDGTYINQTFFFFDEFPMFQKIMEYRRDGQLDLAQIFMNYIKLYTDKQEIVELIKKLPEELRPELEYKPKVYFSSNNHEKYTEQLTSCHTNCTMDDDYCMNLKNGYWTWKGTLLCPKDYPDTGLNNVNFDMSWDFISDKRPNPLLGIDSPIGSGGHDRHVYINASGKLCIRVWPGGTKEICDIPQDENWRNFRCVCEKGKPYKVYLDGEEVGSYTDTDQSNFDWCTRINIGWSNDQAGNYTGKIKNFVYKSCLNNDTDISKILNMTAE